jgi:hypothetical protein
MNEEEARDLLSTPCFERIQHELKEGDEESVFWSEDDLKIVLGLKEVEEEVEP